MKSIFEKINTALLPFFWPIIILTGYLFGTFAYFIIFRNNKIEDFLGSDLLGTSRIFLVLFLVFFISLFIFLGFRYREAVKTRILPIAILSLGIFLIMKYRGGDGGEYVFFVYLSFLLAYILSFTVFEKLDEKIKNYRKILFIALASFFVIFSFYSIFKHIKLESTDFDLGIFTQAMYKFSRFDFSENTVRTVSHIWGDHFHPILFPVSFPMLVFPRAETILIIQAFFVCLAGIPLYLIAREILKNRFASLAIVFAFLFFAGVQKAVDFDFHEIALMPFFFFTSFYLMLKKNWLWYFLSLIPLLACKEDIAILVVFLGLYMIVFRREWRAGALTILISALWFALAVMVIIPALGPEGFIYFQYSTIGATPKEAIVSLLTNPLHALQAMYDHPFKIKTVWTHLSSFGFLPLLSPASLFLVLPAVGEALLNDNILRWSGNHYGMLAAPMLAISATYGIFNINYIFGSYFAKNNLLKFLAIFVVVCSFIVSQSDRTIFERLMEPGFYRLPQAYFDIKELGREIPQDAHLSTQQNIVPQFASRDFIYGYPGNKFEQSRKMDYYLLSVDASISTDAQDELRKKIKSIDELENFLVNRADYGLYKKINGSYLLKRGFKSDPSQLKKALAELSEQRIVFASKIIPVE
ncbi:MAG: hypothetical protein BWY43_00743 [candidate division WS2 bacterium ADurb.Bin280]|uniref:DUF2079 domain-containing protein n=1 Tax=candidate division WS2 bacterium ADurb.Bin280 TaxID=1852829 RepID=A0A1V5SBP9_9BACT|nr:MAG: hypothetical protein BWY43_00743 [candidate division WS2 bacterium ADurb.Bin280]